MNNQNSMLKQAKSTQYVQTLIVALSYFAAGKISLMFNFGRLDAMPFWLPAGIGLAAILIAGYKIWPAIFIGAALLSVQVLYAQGFPLSTTLTVSLFTAASGTLEALISAYLIIRINKNNKPLESVKGTFVFIFLGALLAALVNALFSVPIIYVFDSSLFLYQGFFIHIWLGNALGVLLLTPLFLGWRDRKFNTWNTKKYIELAFFLIIYFVWAYIITASKLPIRFILVSLLLWSIVRFGKFETFFFLFIVSVYAAWAATSFGTVAPRYLLIFQLYFGVISSTFIIFAAMRIERKQADDQIIKANRLYAFISQINQLIVHQRDKTELMKEACRIAIELGKFQMAWFGLLDEETEYINPVAFAGHEDGYLSSSRKISTRDVPEGHGPTANAMRAGVHYVCDDIQNDLAMAPWKDEALSRGYRSSIALPIKVFGETSGVFSLYASVPNFFTEQEINLLDEICGDIGFSFESIETERLRKEITETLNQNQMFVESIIKASPDIIYIYDIVQKRNIYANDGIQKILGFSIAEIQEMGEQLLSDLMHPDDFEYYLSNTYPKYAAAKDNELIIHEYRMKDVEGHWHWLYCKESIFLRQADGTPKQIFGVTVDITDRKQTETNLINLNELHHEILNRISEGFVAFDSDMNYTYVNDFGGALLGCKPQDLIGKNYWKEYPEAKDTPFARAYVQALKTQEPIHMEEYYKDWDRWFENRIFPSSDGLSVFFQEITARKLAEEKLTKKSSELNSINQLSSRINRSLSLDDVISTALSGLTKNTKPDLSYLFMRDGDRLILKDTDSPTTEELFDGVPEHKVGECMCGLAVSQKKALYSINIFTDLRCTWQECKEAGLRSFAALPLMVGDEVIGAIGLASKTERDFSIEADFLETLSKTISIGINNAQLYSNTKQAEIELSKHQIHLKELIKQRTQKLELKTAELGRANLELQRADRLKSIFLASMSHELRTPLNSIIGFTGILLMGLTGELNAEQKKQLQMVKTSSLHLLSLINDILDISKIEAGRVDLSIKRFSFNALVQQVKDSLKLQITEKGLSFVTDMSPDIQMRSDSRRVEQILVNLLSNAIKYTPEGTIRLDAKQLKSGKLKISVSDTGTGISPEDMRKIFEPFQQVNSSLTKKVKGTGLGLYLCKSIVALLNGEITAESSLGKGSVFTVALPISLESKKSSNGN